MTTRIDLDTIRVASPCHESWMHMDGDDRVRFCQGCGQNVYNLTALTRDEAVTLLREHSQGVCVRLHRRADGKVLTSDCPVGAEVSRRKRVMRLAVAGLVLPLFWLVVSLPGLLAGRRDPLKVTGYEPFATVDEALNPLKFRPVTGAIAPGNLNPATKCDLPAGSDRPAGTVSTGR